MSTAELRARLAEIDEQISVHLDILHNLQEDRNLVAAQLDAVTSYPILTLPVEIVAEIFVHCLPIENPKVMRLQAPFSLLKICSRWREIALTTPKLWEALDINVVSLRSALSSRPSSSRWVGVVEHCLRRAQGRPLSLTLRHPHEEYEAVTKYQPDLAFLRAIGRQLEDLEVFGLEQEDQAHCAPDAPLDFRPGSFPILERLVFGPAEPDTDLYNVWLEFFQDSPELRELAVLGATEIKQGIPWHQLTTLTARNFELDQCLDVLRMATDLKYCTMSIQFYEPATALQHVTHRNLQSLRLLPDYEGNGWGEIVDNITLPSLRTLDISDLNELRPNQLEEFLSRSSAELESFKFSFDHVYGFSGWENSFRLIPDTQDLHLICRDLDFLTEFMEEFSQRDNRLFPEARNIFLHIPGTRGTVESALRERRKGGDDKLETASLEWAPEDADLLRSGIQTLSDPSQEEPRIVEQSGGGQENQDAQVTEVQFGQPKDTTRHSN
ncbi:F-box domain-containing protein [Favolaschia claudopus]|uniref:F-box domain-containing protein n=1 Tax=Favolaschia claudopus TaxID=2862362 RepID=A0AAW0ED45_9AGAR